MDAIIDEQPTSRAERRQESGSPLTPSNDSTEATRSDRLLSDAMSSYLGTFLADTPDINGWHAYLGLLAATARADSSTILERSGETRGTFIIPGTTMSLDFKISDQRGQVESRGDVILAEHGVVAYKASVSFDYVDGGEVARAYGVVQFFPKGDQGFYQDGPIGYVYDSDEETLTSRPLGGEMVDGRYWVHLPSESSAQEAESGGLAWAYAWAQRLREVRRSK